jgi:hypothetical protein
MNAYTHPHNRAIALTIPQTYRSMSPWRCSPVRVATLEAWAMLRYYNAWKDHNRRVAEKYFAVADRCARIGRLLRG